MTVFGEMHFFVDAAIDFGGVAGQLGAAFKLSLSSPTSPFGLNKSPMPDHALSDDTHRKMTLIAALKVVIRNPSNS